MDGDGFLSEKDTLLGYNILCGDNMEGTSTQTPTILASKYVLEFV